MTLDVPLVDLKSQYRSISGEIAKTINEVLETGTFILGPQLETFEKEFARYCGVQHGVGVGSGTDALVLGLRALKIGSGDEVITTANTFISSANAILTVGARPVFVDIDPRDYTIDPEKVAKAITRRTKAIMPVHMYGHPADMSPLLELSEERGIAVVEDACQAHGAEYKKRRVGSLGKLSCFSFYPSKNLGAYGDGGIVLTNDSHIADQIRTLRNYGQREKYMHVTIGTNSRLDELQAAILRVKLGHLEEWIQARRRLASVYQDQLNGVDQLMCPTEAEGARHVFYLYVIRHRQRERIRNDLRKAGIGTGIHYPLPIHQQKAYAEVKTTAGDLANTESISRELLSVPMYPELSTGNVERIAKTILRTLRK